VVSLKLAINSSSLAAFLLFIVLNERWPNLNYLLLISEKPHIVNANYVALLKWKCSKKMENITFKYLSQWYSCSEFTISISDLLLRMHTNLIFTLGHTVVSSFCCRYTSQSAYFTWMHPFSTAISNFGWDYVYKYCLPAHNYFLKNVEIHHGC